MRVCMCVWKKCVLYVLNAKTMIMLVTCIYTVYEHFQLLDDLPQTHHQIKYQITCKRGRHRRIQHHMQLSANHLLQSPGMVWLSRCTGAHCPIPSLRAGASYFNKAVLRNKISPMPKATILILKPHLNCHNSMIHQCALLLIQTT